MDLALYALGIYRILLCLKTGAVLTSLPLLLPGGAGLPISLPVAAAILLLPVLGYYSDRIGQRKFILIVEACSALLYLCLPYLPLDAGGLVLLPVAATLIRVSFPITLAGVASAKRKGLALGLLKSLGDIALLFGAVLGSALPTLGSNTVYLLAGLVSLCIAPFGLFVPDARPKQQRGFSEEFRNSLTLPLIAALVWQATGALAQTGWDPLIMQQDAQKAGYLALIIAALLLGTTVSAGIILDHHGLLSAWILTAIDAALLFLAPLSFNFAMAGIIRIAQTLPLSLQSILGPHTALSNKKAGPGICMGVVGSFLLLSETLIPVLDPWVAGVAGNLSTFWMASLGAVAAFLILKYY